MSDKRKGMSFHPREEQELYVFHFMHLKIRIGEKERKKKKNFLITKYESFAQQKIQI